MINILPSLPRWKDVVMLMQEGNSGQGVFEGGMGACMVTCREIKKIKIKNHHFVIPTNKLEKPKEN